MTGRSPATRETLRKLMKEAAAMVALCEPQMREAAGNTNVNILQKRIAEAAAVLAEAPVSEKRPPSDTVLVSRSFLEATPCPNPGCGGTGFTISTGPDHEQEQCQWCYEKRLILSGAERAVASAARRNYCESCGYVESHDPNCPREKPDARALLKSAAELLAGSHASTMFEDQCGHLAEQIEDFLRIPSSVAEPNWKERAEVVECLAKRICRDLRHALDEVPRDNPMREMMVERHRGFKADLGDTSEYVHALHYTIRQLESKVAGLASATEEKKHG